MRIMVLGADGMLGHEVASFLASSDSVIGIVRHNPDEAVNRALARCEVIPGVDVWRNDQWLAVLEARRPDVVVNCIGLVKQRADTSDPAEMIEVNSVFPQRLRIACGKLRTRLIHISTDCVFSGIRGMYRESDVPDPTDVYGRSKLLGEIGSPCLTIRTSIVGLELRHRLGLVEWFLGQNGDIPGYTRAVWSGFTTAELARVIGRLIVMHPDLDGLWHVSSAPISKYDLLAMLGRLLGRQGRVVPDDGVAIDRSLESERFQARTNYEPPSHEKMLAELAVTIQRRMERDAARR